MITMLKKTAIAGAMAITVAAGMTALPGTADAFRGGFYHGGGFHGGFYGRGYGFGYGRGFGYRGYGFRGYGIRGPVFYGAYPYWGGYRCGPFHRLACRYRYGY